jgi:hypothetical protein
MVKYNYKSVPKPIFHQPVNGFRYTATSHLIESRPVSILIRKFKIY